MSDIYDDFLKDNDLDDIWEEDLDPDGLEEWYEDNIGVNITEGEYMPDGVLGMADPYTGDIVIDKNMTGELRSRVIDHEVCHVVNPYLSEWQVRVLTGTTPRDLSYMMSDYSF
ncbi:MAG: hypothetical protein ACLFS3_02830 [Candidatus Aenigmatarchaeota archaeon]